MARVETRGRLLEKGLQTHKKMTLTWDAKMSDKQMFTMGRNAQKFGGDLKRPFAKI